MRSILSFAAAAVLTAGAAVAQTSTAPGTTAPSGSAPGMAPPMNQPMNPPAGGTAPGTMGTGTTGAGTSGASPGTGSATGSSNAAVNPTGNAPSSVNASGTVLMVPPSALERGANSFTEGQAKTRLEGAGLSNVTDLKKDDDGIWRGRAMRAGQSVTVGFDYKGNISAQ